MIRSMTGYARSESEGEWGELAWELRTVNHRYLDVHMRLPEELRALEPEIRNLASEKLGRGKLDCSLRLQAAAQRSGLEIDQAQLQALTQGCKQVAGFIDTAAPDPLRMLQWPGVLHEKKLDTDVIGQVALAALAEALEKLNTSRAEEGGRLEAILRERAATISQQAGEIRQRLPQVRAHWKEKLASRLADIDHPADPGRIEQEIVIFAQRMDVDEELTRLDSHLQELDKALKRDEPVGRRLDFLMQEFNREANTLSSKSQDPEVTRLGVDMKVAIEQMREQVQNVE